MALDPVVNFFRSTIATLPVASGGTSIVLQTGDGNKLPDPSLDGAFNLTIYNADDPFALPEIVRVTGKSGDTLTVTRAQEGTTATNKTSGATWNVELTPTAKTIQDIDSAKVNVADIVNNLTSTDTDKPLSANQGKMLEDGKLDKAGGTMTGALGIGTTPSGGMELDVLGQIRASTGILFGTDTAAANTLDDYEEGTWTPTVTIGVTGTATLSASAGYYVKIGKVVMLFGVAVLSSKNGNTGDIHIENVPFSSTFDGFQHTTQRGNVALNGTTSAPTTNLTCFKGTPFGRQGIPLMKQAATGLASINHADITDTTNIFFSVNYFIN